MTYKRRPPKAAGKNRKEVPSLNDFRVRWFCELMARARKLGLSELYVVYIILLAANKYRTNRDNQWELDWLVAIMCHSWDWSEKYARYDMIKKGIGIFWNKPKKGSDGVVRFGLRSGELVAEYLGTDMNRCLPFEIACKDLWIADELGCRSGNLRSLVDSLTFARFKEPRPCSNAQVQNLTGLSVRTLQRRKSSCVHLNTLPSGESICSAATPAQAEEMLRVVRLNCPPRERGRYHTEFMNGMYHVVKQGANSHYVEFRRGAMRYRPMALSKMDEALMPVDTRKMYCDPGTLVTKAGAEGREVFVQQGITSSKTGRSWTIYARASEPTALMEMVREVLPPSRGRVGRHLAHVQRVAERMEQAELEEFLGLTAEGSGVQQSV